MGIDSGAYRDMLLLLCVCVCVSERERERESHGIYLCRVKSRISSLSALYPPKILIHM